MLVITKNRKMVRSLSEHERDLLARYCDQRLMSVENERASRILREIRHNDHWLVCDCMTPGPTLHVALVDNGKLFLRNNQSSANHKDDCSFGRSASGSASERTDNRPGYLRFDHSDLISLHAEFAGSAGAGKSKPFYAEGTPKKAILSLLFTLLDDAGLTVYDPSAPLGLSEQFARIRAAAGRYTLAQNIALSSAMDTRISVGRMISLGKRLSGLAPKGARPTGLLFDRIDGIKARDLSLSDGKTIPIFGHVERLGTVSGPLLAMATVTTQTPSSSFFELGHVALIPSVSPRHLFPVSSEVERQAVTQIMGLLDWMHGKGVTVTMHRHLFASDRQPGVVLKGREKVVSIFVHEGDLVPLDDGEQIELENTLILNEATDLAVIKRRIAGMFMSPEQDKGRS